MAKAWELAYSPAKSLPMQAIMLYMSGSGVQIFSMMAVGMLITGPIKGISTMGTAFSRFSSPGQSLLLPKLLFVLCQLGGIAVGLYKCWSMGLLPTETSDWLAWRQPRTVSSRPTTNRTSPHPPYADLTILFIRDNLVSRSNSHPSIRIHVRLLFRVPLPLQSTLEMWTNIHTLTLSNSRSARQRCAKR